MEGNEFTTAGERAKSAGLNGPKPMLVAVILGILAVLGVMALPLFCGRVHLSDDLGWLHLPTRIFYADCLVQGEAFDWMPGVFSGYYLTGSGDAAGYHPFHWLLYRWLPLPVALEIEILAAYPFLLLGMYIWLRRLGMLREVAATGSLIFTFSSFCMLHYVHPNMVSTLAHLPWLLAAIDVAVRDPLPARRSGARLAIALLTGSQILLAHPQMVWFSMLVETGYTIFLLLFRRRWTTSSVTPAWKILIPTRSASEGSSLALRVGIDQLGCRGNTSSPRSAARICLELAAAVGLGLMLGAIQILPMLDAAALSMRNTTSAQFVNSYSLYPLNLLQLVAPYMFRNRVILHYTHEFGIYVGAVPLMLILWLPGRTKHLGALRGLLWAGIALAALGVALSLGPLGLLYGLQQYLPLVGKFRCPCRYLVFAELAVSLLASLGLLLLLGQVRREQRATWLELAPIGGLAFVSAATAAVGMALRYVPDLAWVMASSYEILAGPLLFGIAALLFSLAARGWKIGMVGLILFTSIDLGVYGLTYWMLPWNIGRIDSYLKPAPEPPERSAAADVAGVTTAGCRQSRVFINDVTLTFSSCTQVDGYAQLMPARRLDYLRLASLQVAATDWVWKNRENADIAGLLDRGGDWLEVPGALPPVRLVSRAEPSQDPARDLAGVDWHNTVLTDEPMTLTPSPPGSARVIERRPGRIELSIDAPARQILAIAESYHPGWQAMVNGTPEAVFRVNGDFLGCLAGPGRQHVTLVFQPRSLHHGRLISLAAILICCGWAAWVLARSVHHARGQTDRPRESVVH